MKQREEQSCECGHIATEIDEGNGRLCLECCIMWDYALNRFDMSAGEYAAVPIKRRLDFLSDKLSGAILAGAQVQPEWTREVLYMLDSIKEDQSDRPVTTPVGGEFLKFDRFAGFGGSALYDTKSGLIKPVIVDGRHRR